MTQESKAPTGLGRWGLYLGGWLLVGLLLSGLTVLYGAYAGGPITWRRALVYPMTDALAWALLAQVALRVVRRVPLERGRLARSLVVHLPTAFVVSTLEVLIVFVVFRWFGMLGANGVPLSRAFGSMALGKLQTNLIFYAIVVAVGQALEDQRRFRERERRAAQLEARLAEARLAALRSQLQPHFLFNTLHAISALMHRDVEAADRMLARLSDLLRLSIECHGAPEVTLQRELEFLDGYLEIQQARFGDRLRIEQAIEDETRDVLVPHLILQPLVENAIHHGLSHRAAGGRVVLTAGRRGDVLRIDVRDDGEGLPQGFVEGVGLSNTRDRLGALYGAGAEFTVENARDGGTAVRVLIPWRVAAERLESPAAGVGAS